ncbi:hypothetical protein HPB52_003390 [Rhipicephalus sanguineus]|uniref:Uncharacterized protein n=1 Tax=Rhipicephalus sanguineus TaxID=34632 RepID=A0A9D4PU25_RHISA|nr:hypothetical protein HPB52_003390 [Rhipicephalus sanguineus]
MGEAEVTEEVKKVLARGPKFTLEPGTAAHKLLSLNRRAAEKASSEDQERCLLDGVDALSRSTLEMSTRSRSRMNTVGFHGGPVVIINSPGNMYLNVNITGNNTVMTLSGKTILRENWQQRTEVDKPAPKGSRYGKAERDVTPQ